MIEISEPQITAIFPRRINTPKYSWEEIIDDGGLKVVVHSLTSRATLFCIDLVSRQRNQGYAVGADCGKSKMSVIYN